MEHPNRTTNRDGQPVQNPSSQRTSSLESRSNTASPARDAGRPTAGNRRTRPLVGRRSI